MGVQNGIVMSAFETAYAEICLLVKRFDANLSYFMRPEYQEAEVRKDFIDKFFISLGWDVNHDIQSNPYEQEVRVEKTQKQQESIAQRRADYAFYINPNFKDVQFFVEAKKPSVGLRHPDHYFQTVRYGWNANTPIAVLTDFEEFHIIDCRYKPNLNYIFNGQHKVYKYSDYVDKEKFAEIYWLFSREAVAKNSLENYARSLGKPKGKAVQKMLFKLEAHAIDDSFLEYIDGIRETLAKAFKKNNYSLNSEALTEATQKTIDRLVFIRFLEDKLIESTNYVSEWTGWQDFVSDCRKLDAKYNGVVFKKHFIDEQDFTGAEEQMFKDICNDISNLNSPYDFNYIPIHIMGSIYERFLGKVVRTTEKRVLIEEKPEVRKAGGVYYTPKYIVDYIVSNTVGKLIQKKTPKEIDEMQFADISCGSGSFLIGVYECLLDYHKKYYTEKLFGKKEIDGRSEDFGNVEYQDGIWRLTLKRKQDILLNCIYGVDIDPQAVEVTQLSLFLKMLEDETMTSTQVRQGALFSKVLPDLSKNIVCGNSLIDYDIMDGRLFDDDNLKKINPFSIKNKFPQVMRKGGFSAIVGNPPYGAELVTDERDYLLKKFPYGNTDTAALFMIHARGIVRRSGMVGYIIPKAFTYASNWKKIREGIISDLTELIDCSKVWKEVKLEMSVYISQVGDSTKGFVSYIRKRDVFVNVGVIPKELCKEFGFLINGVSEGEVKVATKVKESGKTLNDYVLNQRGSMLQQHIKERGEYEVWGGKKIARYALTKDNKGYVDKNDINDNKAYIRENSILVQNIVAHVMNPYPRVIIIASIPQEPDRSVILDTVNQLTNISKVDSYCLLGILNSKLISWYTYKFVFANAIRTMHFDSVTTARVPFPILELNDDKTLKLHNKMVKIVKDLIESKKQLTELKTDKDINFLVNKIENYEAQIDGIVYALFGLNEMEISIIENQ